MRLLSLGSLAVFEYIGSGTAGSLCDVVFLLGGVLSPAMLSWPDPALAVSPIPLFRGETSFRPESPPPETTKKKAASIRRRLYAIPSVPAAQFYDHTVQWPDALLSTRSVDSTVERPKDEELQGKEAFSALYTPTAPFWVGLFRTAKNKLSALLAQARLLWRRCRSKISSAVAFVSLHTTAAMSGGLPSSRSLEGRSFLNLAADRPPPPPFLHLSASNYAIEPRSRDVLQQRLEETARCLKSAGRARASSAKKEPFVYVGAPGIAFAFLKVISLDSGDKLKSSVEAVESFLSPDIVAAGIEEAKLYPQLETSLLSGPAGVCIVRALRALQYEQLKLVESGMHPAPPLLVRVPAGTGGAGTPAKGNDESRSCSERPLTPTPLPSEFKKAVHQFEKYGASALQPEAGDEWLYGRAGYLFGCLFLDYLSPGCISESLITKVASEIILSGRRRAEDSGRQRPPLRYTWHKKEYTGAAHGYFGILHMLMQVKQIRNDKAAVALIRDTLDWLLEMETSKHNWPAAVGEHDAPLCHFCHGATGAAIVYSTAARVFNDSTYRNAAERAGECVWRYGLLKKGAGICHGIGGSGYGLLAVYQATENPVWMDRAVEHAIKAFDEKIQADSRVPDNPYSLFEGVAGAMCLLADLLKDPKAAAFPFFQIGF